jgi:hypothetical protein
MKGGIGMKGARLLVGSLDDGTGVPEDERSATEAESVNRVGELSLKAP